MAGSPQFVQGVREAASALGMDPTDLATIISYETAGTFDPAKKGPTTQWGQHKGLIQFGEPQARAHGVDWNNPEASQLGADGAIVRYFRSSGWKPGMGMLDAYSIVNAGGPGLYNRSDANNGGAPGTVADKVRTQMGGHRKNAIRLLGGSGQPPQATVSTQGAAPMMQQKEQQPRGLLEGFGVQRRDETAGGETAQPFYQRDSFKDTAALLAQGFGRMGIMGMEEIADDIAKQRTENKAKNKTIEYLRKSGRDDLADAVAEGLLGGSDAAKLMFAKPQDDRTALQKNYEFFVSQGMSPEQAMAAVKSGPTINMGDVGQGEYLYGAKAGLKPGYRLHIKTGVASAIPGGPADTAADEAKAAEAGLGTQATAGTTVLGDITEMKRRIKESPILTTGFIGGLLKNYGGTGALDVNELGKTIRANIGFDRLQRMREESPTGGALGQVAVQELEALQASLGSLNTSQGAAQLIRNLERLETQYRKSMERILETEGGAAYFTQGEADLIKNPQQGSQQTTTGVTYKVIN